MITNQGKYSPEAYDYYWAAPERSDRTVVDEVILPGIREATDEFGVEVTRLPWGEVPRVNGKVPYVLVGPLEIVNEPMVGVRNPLEGSAVEYLSRLAALPDVRLNMVTAYKTEGDRYALLLLGGLLSRGAAAWGIDILGIDRRLGGNSIYTDTLLGGVGVTNNAADIADNIRCETFRLGYTDIRNNAYDEANAMGRARYEAAVTINDISKTIEDNRLWHRAPTDGAIFVKTEEGWLASQTQSDKSDMGAGRLSLIQSFDPDANEIVSTGERPPSSDAPEFLAAFDVLDGVKLAVHFHSNGITRLSDDPYIDAHRTPQTIRYGRFSSTDQVVAAIRYSGDGWTILKEHGVLWTGDTAEDFAAFIDSAPIAEAHQARP